MPEPIITSLANPTIKHLVRMRDNRARRRAGRVLTDGVRETTRAIEAGMGVVGLFASESSLARATTTDGDELIRTIGDRQIQWVSEAVLKKIAYGDAARQIVGEFVAPTIALDNLDLPTAPLVMILDRIEKPGNLGAIFRCADAAGVDAVLLCESTDRFNPNAIRNSQAAVFTVPAAVGDIDAITKFVVRHEIRLLAARVESSTPLWDCDLRGGLAIVLGNEAEGLGDRWTTIPGAGDHRMPIDGVRIPMNGRVDSLNVSITAAILAFEAARVRSGQN